LVDSVEMMILSLRCS